MTKTKTKAKTIIKPFTSFRNAPQCKNLSNDTLMTNKSIQDQASTWQTLAILLERRLKSTNKLIDNL